nr:hypothetical protein [Chloroflexaceae bacterium]
MRRLLRPVLYLLAVIPPVLVLSFTVADVWRVFHPTVQARHAEVASKVAPAVSLVVVATTALPADQLISWNDETVISLARSSTATALPTVPPTAVPATAVPAAPSAPAPAPAAPPAPAPASVPAPAPAPAPDPAAPAPAPEPPSEAAA